MKKKIAIGAAAAVVVLSSLTPAQAAGPMAPQGKIFGWDPRASICNIMPVWC